jgi:GNAT superfamily N-acetyltransferase
MYYCLDAHGLPTSPRRPTIHMARAGRPIIHTRRGAVAPRCGCAEAERVDSRLPLVVAAHDGAFSLAQAVQAQISRTDLATWVRQGVVTRVRRGAFVETGRYQVASEQERYRLRVRAVLASRSTADIASHHAALALRRLPLWRVDLRRIDVVAGVVASTGHGGLVVHLDFGVGAERIDGLRTRVDHAGAHPGGIHFRHRGRVVAADAALLAGRCTVATLRAELHVSPAVRGRWRATAMVEAVDPRCESVGESRLRLLLRGAGLPVRPRCGSVTTPPWSLGSTLSSETAWSSSSTAP